MRKNMLKAAAAALLLSLGLGTAHAQDVPTIRFARQTAAEDNLWLLLAKPELAPNLNKAYRIEWSQLRASDAAFKAYEGGQVDMFTTAASATISAASKGLDFRIIASLSREGLARPGARFLVKNDTGPKTIAELKGKTIGIVGYRTAIELWAREGLKRGGLNPDRDVQWAIMPFPTMPDAILAGKIDVAGVADPFGAKELGAGTLRTLFTSKDAIPFDEELIVISARPDFLQKHPAAVRALISDLVATTKYYEANTKEARQALLDAKLIALPPEVYLNLSDYVRAPGLKPSVELLAKQQDVLVSSGFQDRKIDINKLVDLSFVQ